MEWLEVIAWMHECHGILNQVASAQGCEKEIGDGVNALGKIVEASVKEAVTNGPGGETITQEVLQVNAEQEQRLVNDAIKTHSIGESVGVVKSCGHMNTKGVITTCAQLKAATKVCGGTYFQVNKDWQSWSNNEKTLERIGAVLKKLRDKKLRK